MTQLSTLNKYFWKYKWLFSLGILFVVLTNYFRILAPQITGYVVNTVVSTISKGDTQMAGEQSTKNYDVIVRAVIRSFDSMPFNKKILFAGLVLLFRSEQTLSLEL